MLKFIEMCDIGPVRKAHLELSPRFNFLTGDNGLGKTFFLDAIWWALTRDWANDRFVPLSHHEHPKLAFSHADMSSQVFQSYFREKRWSPIGRGSIGSAAILYVQADGGICLFDTNAGPRPINFKRDQVWEGLQRGDKKICDGLVADWNAWKKGTPEQKELFELLASVLEALSPSEDETLRPSRERDSLSDNDSWIPTIEMPYGAVPVTTASAGIRRVVALAYMMVWMYARSTEMSRQTGQQAKHFVVILDEVESHLHPQWQRRLIPALFRVVKELHPEARIQFIASTHAPLVLASVESIFRANEDALFCLELREKEVVVEKQIWQIQGEVSAWLTSDVFGLAEARSLDAERAIATAMDAVDRVDIPPDRLRMIHNRLRESLNDTDPFWVRWLYYAERKGI